jgi:chromosome segregation ATPase
MDSTPTGTLNQVMVKGDKTYYFPYRLITSRLSYVNPFGDNKYISFFMTEDNGKGYQIRVKLPYKYLGWHINDEEGNKIASLVNDLSTDIRGKVVLVKQSVQQASSQYMTNKPVLDSASKDNSTLQKQAADLKTSQDELLKKIKELKDKVQQENKAMASLKSQANDQNVLLSKLEADLSVLSKTKDELTLKHETYKGKSSLSETEVKDLKGKVDVSLSNWKQELDKLNKLAPERKIELDSSNTALLALKKDDINSNFKKIRPYSS